MIANFQYRIFLIFIGLMIALSFRAMGVIPPPPNPPRLVNDFAQVLEPNEVDALEQKLSGYALTHGTQIAVVTILDLDGMAPAEFADRLAEAWGIGQQGRENGLLILINPREGRGQVHISVGYGLEGVIPDITARRIVDQEIIPHFRAGNFFAGIDSSTNVLMQLASGEFTAADYGGQPLGNQNVGMLIFILLFVVIGSFMRRSGRSHYSAGKKIPFWTLLMLMSTTGRGSAGSWGQFSGGTGRYGGGFGSGGGFGGFGGGGFGGGGAGGSW